MLNPATMLTPSSSSRRPSPPLPPQGGLYEALGSTLWRLGRYGDAQQAYETALKLDPSDTITMYKLGCLRVDRSDAAGGKPLLEQVRVADPRPGRNHLLPGPRRTAARQ